MRGLVKARPADYTFFMPLVLSIATIVLLGQFDAGAAGMEPYVFVKRGEDAGQLYVLVEPEDLEQTRNPFIVGILDEPWLPIEQRRLRLSRSDYEEPYPEASSTRKRRIDEGWEAHGGIQVDTREGKVWVHKEDADLARRAEEMAAAARGDESAASATAAQPAGDAVQEPLGFWTEWGMHVAIIGGAVVLTAVVIWAMLVRGPWTALRP